MLSSFYLIYCAMVYMLFTIFTYLKICITYIFNSNLKVFMYISSTDVLFLHIVKISQTVRLSYLNSTYLRML